MPIRGVRFGTANISKTSTIKPLIRNTCRTGGIEVQRRGVCVRVRKQVRLERNPGTLTRPIFAVRIFVLAFIIIILITIIITIIAATITTITTIAVIK